MAQPYGASEEFYRYNAPRRPSERLPDQAGYLQGLQRGGDNTAAAIQRGGEQEAAHTREMYAIASALPEKLVKNFLDGMKFRQDRVKWKDDLDNTALKRDLDRNTDSRAGAKEGRDVLKFEEDQARWPMERDELQGKINYMDAQRGYVGANTQKVDSERLFEQGDNPLQRGMEDRQRKYLLDKMKADTDALQGGAAAALNRANAGRIASEEAWLSQPAMVQPPGRENVIPYAPGKAPPAKKPKPVTNRQAKAQGDLDKEAANAIKAKADAIKAQAEAAAMGKGGGLKLTEGQSKKRTAGTIGALSEQQYQDAVSKGKRTGTWDPTAYELDNFDVPLIPRGAKSAASREGEGAARRWVSTFLRDESGATLPPGEIAEKALSYFPRRGDSPQAVADKEAARRTQERLARQLGYVTDDDLNAAGVMTPGTIEDGYRYLGGDKADPKNWQKVK